MSYQTTDNRSSPECLLTSEAVKDPYFTDTEEDRDFKEGDNNLHKLISHHSTSYNGSIITIQSLKKYFEIEFQSLHPGPTHEELLNMEISAIMDQIMFFMTNKKDSYSMTVLEELIQNPERGTSVLYYDKDFQINFKDLGSILLPTIVETSSGCYRQACNFIQKLSRVLWVTREALVVEPEYHYHTVKACMAEFCRLTYEYIWENGECINVMQSTKRTARQSTVHFKSHPNLVLNSACKGTPGIPFEVYSPIKEKKNSESGSQLNIRNESTNIPDIECTFPIEQFLSENVPVFIFEKSKTMDTNIKNQLVTQHILQIIGVASNYCFEKYSRAVKQMEKSKVFVGLLVSNEYVYITKIQGDESTFAKYHKGYQSFIVGKDQMQLWLSRGIKTNNDSVIHVQFSSIVLDLSIHNHRMALLLFMQYYMNKWDVIKVDLENEK